jgi:uncharacterized repeat protein (TIGR01451 family)
MNEKNAKIIGILVTMLLISSIGTVSLLPSEALATDTIDDEWPNHKMHYPQLPDESGWDVYATVGLTGYPQICLADDWMCSETGPVTDIHFWGSWKNGLEGVILGFNIAIHADIPADQSPTNYSMPGDQLWVQNISVWDTIDITSPTFEGWYDPYTGEILYNDHNEYFQYNIINITDPFIQQNGTIYWLRISAIVLEDPTGFQPLWGWKTSLDHWNDDACWADWYIRDWVDLWEPSPPAVTNLFWVGFDEIGNPLLGLMGGTDYYSDGTDINGWYFYPISEWWNIWFYDHPFDYDRYKEIFTAFNLWKYNTGQPSYVEVALNWATDLWPPDSPPPIPPDDVPYIARETILVGQDMEGFFEFFYEILDYNPEWVSIDVRGYNFVITDGFIEHACLSNQSLDMAFVITGEQLPCEPGIDVEKYVWDDNIGGWADQVDLDVGETAEFLIAIHNNGTCNLTGIWVDDFMEDSFEFINANPIEDSTDPLPGGLGIYWWFDLSGDPLTPCNTTYITINATVLGPICHTDFNYVTVHGFYTPEDYVEDSDDASVHATGELWPNHKMHYPQLPDPSGWDVFAWMPNGILADDFMCNETGPITDLHFWGSWYNDMMPNPEGNPLGFHISIHEDIPDPDGDGPLYSMPGTLLWERDVYFFNTTPMAPSLQGWYEPPSYYEEYNHELYFQYDIFFEEPYFNQVEGTIYWVDIAPHQDAPGYFWGWKTSLDHWNDDAVYSTIPGWGELRDPITNQSLDMAFVITGEEQQPSCDLDVFKYVWNETIPGWDEYIEVLYDTVVRFNISVHNNGTGTNISDIWVYDDLPQSLDYEPGGATVNGIPYEPDSISADLKDIDWYLGYTLAPCEWIYVEFDARVVKCGEIDINWGSADGFCDYDGSYLIEYDSASVFGLPIPSIDVEKYVWNETLGDWDELAHIEVGEIAEFLITIHNNGTCCNLTNRLVYDFMNDSMEFLDAVPYPDSIDPVPGGTELYWNIPSPLPPCNWVNITVFARVLGPVCHTDINYIFANGYCNITDEWVSDFDDAFVHATEPAGWYWKSPYPNYAPHIPGGMPDFDSKQDNWKAIKAGPDGVADTTAIGDDMQVSLVGSAPGPNGIVVAPGPNCQLDTAPVNDDVADWAFCGPVAIANCFWWFDSKFADPAGVPGDGMDNFSMVEDYGVGDDHSSANVPYLIEDLAGKMHTCANGTTHIYDMQDAIDDWLVDKGLSHMFEENTYYAPTFDFIEGEIERSQDVILLLGFYNFIKAQDQVQLMSDTPKPLQPGPLVDYQEFLPTVGTLDAIKILIHGGPGPVIINVYDSAFTPIGTTVYDPGFLPSPTWVQFHFDPPVPLLPGLPHYFDVSTPAYYDWWYIGMDVYPGMAWINTQPGPFDWTFQTEYYDYCNREKGHYVTCAGVNSNKSKIAFSDPELNIMNPAPTNHNDPANVSHDIYNVNIGCPCPSLPYNWWLPGYPSNYDFTIVEQAVVICPKPFHHITNLSVKWNFVSLPFNQSINKADMIIRYNGTDYNWSEAIDPANGPLIDSFIFGWKRGLSGQTYQSVNKLDPGYGYWMYAYSDCELWAQNISVVSDNYVTDLGVKWNAMGVPYDQSVDKTDLIFHYNGTAYNWTEAIDPANGPLVDAFIFGWKRGPSGQTYQAVDSLKPGYSYWMYAYYPCTLKR